VNEREAERGRTLDERGFNTRIGKKKGRETKWAAEKQLSFQESIRGAKKKPSRRKEGGPRRPKNNDHGRKKAERKMQLRKKTRTDSWR